MRTFDQENGLNSNQADTEFCGDLPNGDIMISCMACGNEQPAPYNIPIGTPEFCSKCGKELMYCIRNSW